MAFSSYWTDDPDHDIAHYGVKGMKWGVRKSEYRTMSRAQRKQVRKDYKTAKKYRKRVYDNAISIHNETVYRHAPVVEKLNKEYDSQHDDRETYARYAKEYQKSWNSMLVSEAIRQVGAMPKNVTSDQILALLPVTVSDADVDDMLYWYDRSHNK